MLYPRFFKKCHIIVLIPVLILVLIYSKIHLLRAVLILIPVLIYSKIHLLRGFANTCKTSYIYVVFFFFLMSIYSNFLFIKFCLI